MSGAGEFGSEILGPEEHARIMQEQEKLDARNQRTDEAQDAKDEAKFEITKPCPFCGTPARCEDGEHEENMGTGCDLMPRVVGDWRGVFIVYCKMCGARGPECRGGTEEAIREWNSAKWVGWADSEPPAASRDEIVALRNANDRLRIRAQNLDLVARKSLALLAEVEAFVKKPSTASEEARVVYLRDKTAELWELL